MNLIWELPVSGKNLNAQSRDSSFLSKLKKVPANLHAYLDKTYKLLDHASYIHRIARKSDDI